MPSYSVNGVRYKLSTFTPRFMLDNNLSCVISDRDYNQDCVLKYSCDYSDKLGFIPFGDIGFGYVMLFNGDPSIEGLHMSKNSVESSLYFLSGYPYEMVMNRFMYPNPKLVKKLIDK